MTEKSKPVSFRPESRKVVYMTNYLKIDSLVCMAFRSQSFVRIRPNPQWVRIMVSPVKGALPVRVDSNRRLADRLRGPWLNGNIELWNGLVRSPRLEASTVFDVLVVVINTHGLIREYKLATLVVQALW